MVDWLQMVPRNVQGCVFITAIPLIKLFAWGEGESGGNVPRETTSRGRCGLGCPSRTSERGGQGDCVKEGGGNRGSTFRAISRNVAFLIETLRFCLEIFYTHRFQKCEDKNASLRGKTRPAGRVFQVGMLGAALPAWLS